LIYENFFELELKPENFMVWVPGLKPFDFPLGICGSDRAKTQRKQWGRGKEKRKECSER
jgi:hypothetical protein